ncbi:hypothetical protein LLEC1_05528 [Akanthomyces lecanii]|uniref:Aminoglycoside phosphotransferase domain-containing protein n=1 Tax=Cordyceps confragosa TaxID=2714763 RepID=A0A179IJU2_CORDF|nr:hypothetical protein LLEC1_05528 [Akanthomyces lecanii]
MGEDLFPENVVLQHIFNGPIQNSQISVFLQDWDKCVFKVDPDTSATSPYKEPVVVRLESAEQSTISQFALATEIQNLAAETLSGLVPPVLKIGQVKDSRGGEYCFSVVGLVDGATLDSVWANLNESSRRTVVADVVEAIKKLYTRKLSEENVQAVLQRAARSQDDARAPQPLLFGGAYTTILKTGEALLDKILESRKLWSPFCHIKRDENRGTATIHSRFSDLGSLTIHQHEMSQWVEQAVLCHNDLTPKNILLKKVSGNSSEDEAGYRLAGIIDWENGGLYPAAYEAQIQDTYLPSNNRHVSFYMMMKEGMGPLIPRNNAQEDLLRAMELIYESQQRHLFEGGNIPGRIRQRFLSRYNLARHSDPFAGWTIEVDDLLRCDANAVQRIEDQVVAEYLARQAAGADKEAAEKGKARKKKTKKSKAKRGRAELKHERAKLKYEQAKLKYEQAKQEYEKAEHAYGKAKREHEQVGDK